MAQNRTLPYGYKIGNGQLTPHQHEVEVVVQIFKKYADGQSYKNIAQWLTASGVRYTPDKPNWNKNMVARILQNKNYLGNGKYAAIVDEKDYEKAQLQMKPYTQTECEDIKILKPLLVCAHCKEPLSRRLKASGTERWYCPNDTTHIDIKLTDEALLESILELQEKLIKAPKGKKATADSNNKQLNLDLIRIKNQIDLALTSSEPNIEEIKNSIMSLAVEKYKMLDSESIHTTKINHIIANIVPKQLNSKAIKEISECILVSHISAVEIILKNREKVSI